MKANSISSRACRRPTRLAADQRIVRVVSGSQATARESQISFRRPRCTADGSLITDYSSPITHLQIGSAPIRNDGNSSAINARRFSNRYKFGCFRARCSRFLHSTSHKPHRATQPFLIAGEKILKTELTPSVPSPNAFLIAGDFPPFSSAAAPRISNRYTKLLEIDLTRSQQTRKHFLIATICPTFFSPAPLRAILIGTPRRLEIELTHSQQTRKHFLIGTICPTFFSPAPLLTHRSSPITHHRLTLFLFDTNGTRKIVALMKTKEKRLSIRYKFSLRASGAANYPSQITTHQSLIIPHKSGVTNHDSRYNCASLSAAGQSNRQPSRAAGYRQPARHETGFGRWSSNVAALKRTTHEPAR